MTESPIRVELRGVSKRFGSFVAVNNVDLAVKSGEFLTLLGPSGCGKTTMLRMLSGFEYPSEGRIFLDGADVTNVPPFRRNVNQVFQSYALFPHQNVVENIGFGLRMQNLSKPDIQKRVEDAVELVALRGFERRMPSELSGGQRQRVALARALVCQPKVLLLDEPLSALDAKLRQQMQIELKRLQQKLGMTFVFVTHDQEEALTMSDRIAVVNKGRIEQLATADEIYHNPRTAFVAHFIGEANILEAKMLERSGQNARFRIDSKLELNVLLDDFVSVSNFDPNDCWISIRPERIRMFHARPEGPNVFQAHIYEEIFRGATDRLEIRSEAGIELTVVVANEGIGAEEFRQGETVYCQVHPDDIVVLQDQ